MNKKILKSIIMIGISIATMLILSTISNAASLSISTSKSSVSPGEVFTATITLNGGAGPITASVKNGSGSGTQFLDGSSMTISCTAGSSGTVTVSASGTVGDYATEQDVKVSNSKSVTIVVPETKPVETPTPTTTDEPQIPTKPTTTTTTTKPTTSTTTKPTTSTTTKPTTSTTNNNTTPATPTKSSNSRLTSLEIAEGAATPEFSSDVTEYSISVANEITRLNIAATPEHSKATANVTGNEELQVGENTIEIVVTAEDGSTTTYKVIATRALPELNLQTLGIYYIDENGEKVVLKIEPEFVSNIYEYNIEEKLSHSVEKVEVEATATRENAEIKITGNEVLQTGKNEIVVKAITIGEEGAQEEKTYTINVEKEEEPVAVQSTKGGKIAGIFTSIGKWASTNHEKIVAITLLIATLAFIGLTIYLIFDYKRYQELLAKLAEYNKANLMEKANVALNPEKAKPIEQAETQEERDKSDIIEEFFEESKKGRTGRGRRYK